MRLALALLVGLILVGLGGCVLLDESPKPAILAKLRVSLLSDGRTAVLDGSGSIGEELKYFWDLGDGTPPFEGDPIVRHIYGIGAYVVRLQVVGRGRPPGQEDGRPGDPPGGWPPNPHGTIESWTYAIVDTARRHGPTAIIIVLDMGGKPSGPSFWSGYLTFYGEASLVTAGPLTYRWEVVRVDAAGNPIPYSWATEPEYIVSDRPTWTRWIPGPGCLETGPYRYRVTLRVRDGNWQEDTAVTYIEVY